MKIPCQTFASWTAMLLLTGCSVKEAPTDSNGKTPQQVLMETYVLIVEGKHDEAKNHFSAEFIKEFVTDKNMTFADYCSNTKGWKVEWLKTKVVGND